MKISLILLCNIILTLKGLQASIESEQKALCNQVLDDIINLRQESANVNKRVYNHMKEMNSKLDKISGISNLTSKIQNVFDASQATAANTITLLLDTLTAVNNTVQQVEEQAKQLDLLDTKLNSLDVKLDFQMKFLQEMNGKFIADHDRLVNISQELKHFKDTNIKFQNTVLKPRRRLPTDVVLGFSSANLTTS